VSRQAPSWLFPGIGLGGCPTSLALFAMVAADSGE
jgi:hypothetical protein